ncbi:hypothetical protein CXF96_08115 [Stenotrophomonas sp. Betaine-02u-21]|uniref:hypothetical protein n=1 Tax=unclassified Stenotrophomonas TaxID=196198 RepID=UPI000C32336C|nr:MULTISPECIES: hypothetical protein [unclassified Stenotrophomonas]MRI40980.1 hypothetical protein [Stenotrophomonas sp. MH181796]PKH69848.1 hypothetical protein CXF90_17505 [Stenotrophomonas sp. Betaine-02u-23]PKH74514.1 hypothetical protein CXF96_08115 [Stenotrophomonas sp. Betaine-02u-21]PKH94454.1 hypothetical protein CXG43_17520 [Stenotrophomonas sp. Bg11-02]
MEVDQLDVAYIAIGAKQALDKSGAPYAKVPFQGELGYVQVCIDQAELLTRAWRACSEVFPGVWCYEVAEPFGVAFGKHLLAGGGPESAQSILNGVVAAAMATSPA